MSPHGPIPAPDGPLPHECVPDAPERRQRGPQAQQRTQAHRLPAPAGASRTTSCARRPAPPPTGGSERHDLDRMHQLGRLSGVPHHASGKARDLVVVAIEPDGIFASTRGRLPNPASSAPPCGLRAVDFLRERGTGRVHRSTDAPDRARPSAPDASPVGSLPRTRPDFLRERCPDAVNATVLESPVQRTGGNE